MLNDRQLDIADRILVNTANLVLGTLVVGGILTRGINWKVVIGGSILFALIVSFALWLRKGGTR